MTIQTVTPELLTLLGKAVVDFGFMESLIPTLIISLSKNNETRALVPPSNTVSQNIIILRRLCLIKVPEVYRKDWNDAISSIERMYTERNRIFHGMFIETDQKLYLAKMKKGKNGVADKWQEIEFDSDSFEKIICELSDRRRQIMDFIFDYLISDPPKVNPPSQYAFPSLMI